MSLDSDSFISHVKEAGRPSYTSLCATSNFLFYSGKDFYKNLDISFLSPL